MATVISNYKPINGYFTYACVNKGTGGKLEQRAGLMLDPDHLGGRSIGDAGQWYLNQGTDSLTKIHVFIKECADVYLSDQE